MLLETVPQSEAKVEPGTTSTISWRSQRRRQRQRRR